MSKQHKGNYRKTPAEVQGYRDFVMNSQFSASETVPSQNEMLIGSGEILPEKGELEKQQKVLKTPLKYRILDWLKANVFPVIITTAIIGVASATISHLVKIAVLTQRVDALEKQVQSIDCNYIDKDYLQLQVDNVKLELSGHTDSAISDITWHIKSIENRISSIMESIQNEK